MVTLIFLALALSADAFAAALCRGAGDRERSGWGDALTVGAAFGGAQALMPVLGWGLGVAFASVIASVDHWIAFGLLGFLGARMVREGLKRDEPDCEEVPAPTGMALLLTAIATSIDAAAAGVSLPLLAVPIAVACFTIGAVTFVLSAAGVRLGGVLGARFGKRAEVLGGLALIALGTKILIEHQWFGG